MKNLKFLFMAALFAVAFSSCKELKLVGELNMVSTRNVENVDYVLIKNYEGLSKRQIKKSRAENLNQAIDQTVQNTPGGEFLKNVKVYMIEGTFKTFYAVQGDVWGAKNSTISHMGFKVGDRVQWKVTGNTKSGKITNLKDGTQATIQEDDSQNFVNVEYKKLTIIQKSE